MSPWLEAAAKITNQYALAAYAIAALVSVLGVVKRGRIAGKPLLIAAVVGGVLVSASLPLVAKLIGGSLYRVSVSVSDHDGNRVKDCTVTTDVPSQAYQIGDSKQIEISPAHLQANRRVVFYASDNLGREGQSSLDLGDDRTPTVNITLATKASEIRGNVLDTNGKGVVGARVSVIGYAESATSTEGGLFVIQTHVPSGQPIYLLVEKDGFQSLRQQHLAGPNPATLVLQFQSKPHRQQQ